MPASVVVDFQIAGISKVQTAFRTVEQASIRAEKARTATEKAGSRERDQLAVRETRNKERELAKVGREVDKWKKEEVRAAEKAERAKLTEAEKTARNMARIRENSVNIARRYARQEADTEIRELKRAHDARVKFMKSVGGAGASSAGRMLSGGAAMAGSALALGGGFMLGDVVAKRMAAEKSAGLLVNASTAAGTAPAGASIKSVLSQAGAASITTGVSREDLIGGALEYSRKAKGGDFNGAMANMEFFGKMSKVTGANIDDIASAAGTLQSQNQALAKDPKQMQQMLLDIYAQGKAGSMSMVDVAKQVGVLASTRSAYAGDSATNQRKLLALGQLAAPEGSTEEAGTFIKDLTLEAGKHRKSTRGKVGLEQMGVKFDKYGRMDSPEQMIDAVMKYNKGDITQIEDTFGARGKALFGALQPDYVAAGGGDAGIAAINKKMASVTGATMTGGDLDKQFAQTMSADGEKMHVVWMKVEEMFDQAITPALGKFADKLPEIVPQFQKLADKLPYLIENITTFVSWFADNPIKGIGAAVLGKILADMARAAIGDAIKTALLRAIGGQVASSAAGGAASGAAPGGAAVAGGAGSRGGTLATAGVIAGLAFGAEQTGEAMIDSALAGKTKAGANVQSLIGDVRNGKITAAQAQSLVDKAKAGSGGLTGAYIGAEANAIGGVVGALTGNKDNAATKFAQDRQTANAIANSTELQQAIAKALIGGSKIAAPQMQAMNNKGSTGDPSRNHSIAQRPVQ